MQTDTSQTGGVGAKREQWTDRDSECMKMALELAREAGNRGEIPVGAVITLGGEIVGSGANAPIGSLDPTAHAEIQALRQAALFVGNYRLPGATLYTTLEPCVMCAGAITFARLQTLIYAARDLRFGAIRSKFRLADSDLLNHCVEIREGLLAAEASELLRQFFRTKP